MSSPQRTDPTLTRTLALALALTLTLTLTRYTPEQLAARNKKRTLESDVFHRKPARCRGDVGRCRGDIGRCKGDVGEIDVFYRKPAHERSSNPYPKP